MPKTTKVKKKVSKPKDKVLKDAYWTQIIYHNSKRELGKTITLCNDDIPSKINTMIVKDEKYKRKLKNIEELSGSKEGYEIPQILERLNVQNDDDQNMIDILPCTNMISVGVDVPRLGLMLINGQPKTTAEYIQASSRIGRSDRRPGIVVTHYSPTKPRDRSHYENFISYHDSIYRYVEPTSVTPFSPPAMERALHAALVIVMRQTGELLENDSADLFDPNKKEQNLIIDLFLKRIIQGANKEQSTAKKYLDKNHCVAVSTETVYGLAGNAYSNISVKKIFNLKRRPLNNPLIVHYYDINRLKIDCHINDDFIKLYKKFSPGAITFILKLKKDSKISKLVTNKQNSLAVRFPKHLLFRKLLKNLNYPLAAPSANISTRLSSVQASDVKEEFGSKIKYILDGGRCKIGIESTIINLLNKPTILRFGGLEKKISIKTNSKKKITPCQFSLHYSPGIPLRLNAKKIKINEAYLLIKDIKKIKPNYFFLSKKGNLKEAAKNLYIILRNIKKSKYKSIAVAKIPNVGLGKTINDRLNRASKFK